VRFDAGFEPFDERPNALAAGGRVDQAAVALEHVAGTSTRT
jgi:hypothetical protein